MWLVGVAAPSIIIKVRVFATAAHVHLLYFITYHLKWPQMLALFTQMSCSFYWKETFFSFFHPISENLAEYFTLFGFMTVNDRIRIDV